MAERGGRRIVAVMAVAIATAGLAVLTVMGMASGYDRQFDRGVAPRDLVAIQLGLGVMFFIVAALVVWRLIALWHGRTGAAWSLTRWFVVAAVVWVVWLYFRVLQYAS